MLLIPKIFHQVWLGRNAMPPLFEKWRKTWSELHPDWQMKLWTEDNIPRLQNQEFFERGVCYAQKSDVVRYEMVLREGGVYLDTDMEAIRNIEPLIDGRNFFAGYEFDEHPSVSVAMFGAARGHHVLRDLVDYVPKFFSEDIWTSLGPEYMTNVVQRHKDVRILARRVLNPYYAQECIDLPEKGPTSNHPPETYAINHHSSGWFPPSKARLR